MKITPSWGPLTHSTENVFNLKYKIFNDSNLPYGEMKKKKEKKVSEIDS